jgi:hypothetical protein
MKTLRKTPKTAVSPGKKSSTAKRVREVQKRIADRQQRYAQSGIFVRELIKIKGRLERRRDDAKGIAGFVHWFNRSDRSLREVTDRLKTFPPDIARELEAYVLFAYRFRVLFQADVADGGKLTFDIVYREPSAQFLVGELLRNGELIAVRGKPFFYDAELLDYLAASDDERPGFTKSVRAKEVRFLKVKTSSPSPFTRLLDTIYDPLTLNFVVVDRRITQRKTQTYLICVVGELAGATWRHASHVPTEFFKSIYGSSSRGRRRDLDEANMESAALVNNDGAIESSAYEVIQSTGGDYSKAPDPEIQKRRRRVRRTRDLINTES